MNLDMIVHIEDVMKVQMEIKGILKDKVSHKLMKEKIVIKQISEMITDIFDKL